MTKFEFSTVEYEFSHGRKPKGRGSWAFAFERNPEVDRVRFSPSMTYVEAKRWFVESTKAEVPEGRHVVFVLP